jgi:hypothetical protein
MDCDDGSCDVFGVVDNLIYTRHALCNTHAGYTCKMEGLQSHLCRWLADTLGCQGTNRLSWLHDASIHLLDVDFEEICKLFVRNAIESILQVEFIFACF